MRAITIEQHGGPDVLTLTDVPEPEPGPSDVLVEVAHAGVNFIDVYFRTGTYPADLPLTPGKEGSGRIVAVGSEVRDVAVGQRVAWAMGDGAYAERAVVPAHLAVPVPDDVTDETAAAIMLQGLTAHYLTHSITTLRAGDTVLVHAGAGGVGLVLTQLLVEEGVRVLTTTSSEDKARLSREAGADVTLGYDDFAAQVREHTDGAGVRAVFDGVGESTFEGSLDSLAPRGVLALFGASSGPVPAFDPQVLNQKGSLFLTRPSLAHFIADRDELLRRAADLFTLVAAGRLAVRVGGRYPLTDAAEAHRDLEGRRSTGKLLLDIGS